MLHACRLAVSTLVLLQMSLQMTQTHTYVKHISRKIFLTYNYIILILSFPLLLLWTDLHNVMTFEQLPSLSKNMFIRKFSLNEDYDDDKKSNYVQDSFSAVLYSSHQ